MDSGTSPGAAQVESIHLLEGKLIVPGVQLTVPNNSWLTPAHPLDRITDWQTGNWRLDTGTRTGKQQIAKLFSTA